MKKWFKIKEIRYISFAIIGIIFLKNYFDLLNKVKKQKNDEFVPELDENGNWTGKAIKTVSEPDEIISRVDLKNEKPLV